MPTWTNLAYQFIEKLTNVDPSLQLGSKRSKLQQRLYSVW